LDSTRKSDFLRQAEEEIYKEISNERFGVSELAEAVNMSRSNLLRKIKKETGLSASQFIRQIRLARAKVLLEDTDLSISEISYEVGFANTSYFTKCFREDFSYPPGKVRKSSIPEEEEDASALFPLDRLGEKSIEDSHEKTNKESFFSKHQNKIIVVVTLIIVALISFYAGNSTPKSTDEAFERKSLAVLPFKNLSADSSNLYFVNGLMEASLGKLQKIKDLRVVSRTSVEKYRASTSSIPEIGKELNVRYIVEGSGQKNGNDVLLNIQLIVAETDTPVWTEQYNYKLDDVFELQNKVAKKIALAIEANISPTELVKLDKVPTESVDAYDEFLKGFEKSQVRTEENLLEAISYYDKATELDERFALAYAQKAIAYYYLDEFKAEKKYTDQLNENADKALLHDSKSDISLIAKALYYVSNYDFNLAVPHLEKALEYNPNSAAVVLILADLYSRAIPDTSKYLKYALLGIQLNIAANDSISKSYAYLNLSNALIQTGFVKESKSYINQAYDYNPANPYVPYLKAFIDYADNKDLKSCILKLENEWQKDTTRLDLLQEIGKLHYYNENYKNAYKYYDIFNRLKANAGIKLYPQEDLKIGITYKKMGFEEKGDAFIEAYRDYCYKDTSMYQPASLAMLNIYENNYDEAIAELQKFSYEDNFQYWLILFIEKDPLMKQLSSHHKYKSTVNKIKDKFWKNHEETKTMLEENNLLE
jgi:TolB-like protein/AraC-like DNA-binding protein